MTIIGHAKDMAAAIIANQDGMMPQSIRLQEASRSIRKRTKTIGPTTQIRVTTNSPATIISESFSGGIEEFVVISPVSDFAVFIVSNGETKLDKTWIELSAISAQASDIGAFRDADENYILNIKNYRWQHDITVSLRSTSGNFLFNQVYANWYVHGE
jgi:hypothetical protein